MKLKPRGGVVACAYCGEVFTLSKSQDPAAVAAIRTGHHELDVCKFDEAYESFKKASKIDAEDAEAYMGMALAYYKVQLIRDEVKERLQPICHEIDDSVFTQDKNYRKALSLATPEQREQYEKQGKDIDYIRQEFYKLKETGLNYDCFICAKVTDDERTTVDGKKLYTSDCRIAEDLHAYLRRKGYKPFFSEIDIGERTGVDYEALILYALYVSESMLVVCSNESYLQTPWVKNEYLRFLKMIANEEKENDSIAIVYDGNPIETLPMRNGKLQGIDADKGDSYEKAVAFVERHTPEARERRNQEYKIQAEVKYCSDCGTKNPSSAKVCMQCGAKTFVNTLQDYEIAVKERVRIETLREAEERRATEERKENERKRKAEEKRLKREKRAQERKTARQCYSVKAKKVLSAPFICMKKIFGTRKGRRMSAPIFGFLAFGFGLFCIVWAFCKVRVMIYPSFETGIWLTGAILSCIFFILAIVNVSLLVGKKDKRKLLSEGLLELNDGLFGLCNLVIAGIVMLIGGLTHKMFGWTIAFFAIGGVVTTGLIIYVIYSHSSSPCDASCYDGKNAFINIIIGLACFAIAGVLCCGLYVLQNKPDGKEGDFYYYVRSDNTVAVYADTYDAHEVLEIPEEIEGKCVVMLERAANTSKKSVLTQVVFPSNLLYIEKRAFYKCVSLQQVNIPDTVLSIGEEAFAQSGLLAFIVPNGVADIERRAFSDCISLEKVFIPATTRRIQNKAFEGCLRLTIYCERESQPKYKFAAAEYYSDDWKPYSCSVIWNATREQYECGNV